MFIYSPTHRFFEEFNEEIFPFSKQVQERVYFFLQPPGIPFRQVVMVGRAFQLGWIGFTEELPEGKQPGGEDYGSVG